MLLKELKLKNWAQHKEVAITASTSVLGVLGPNGCGKSTLLAAIAFLFTGKLPRGKEKKDYIRYYGQPGGSRNAVVCGVFSHKGKTLSISRKITATSAERKIQYEDREITVEKEVDKFLSELLGTDKDSLLNAVFIPQKELDAIVTGTQGSRENLFAKLMHISFLERRVDKLNGFISKLQAGLVDIQPVIDSENANLQAFQDQLVQLEANPPVSEEKRIALLRKQIDLLGKKEAAHRTATDALSDTLEAAAREAQLLSSYGGSLRGLEESINAARQDYATVQSRIEYFKTALADKSRVEQAKSKLEDLEIKLAGLNIALLPAAEATGMETELETWRKVMPELAAYEKAKQELHDTEQALEVQDKQVEQAKVDLDRQQVETDAVLNAVSGQQEMLQEMLGILNAKLSVARQMGTQTISCCPICNNSNISIQFDTGKLEEEAAALNRAIADIKAKTDKAAAALQQCHARHEMYQAAAERVRNRFEAAKKSMPDRPCVPAEYNVSYLHGKIADLESQLDAHNRNVQEKVRLEEHMASLQSMLLVQVNQDVSESDLATEQEHLSAIKEKIKSLESVMDSCKSTIVARETHAGIEAGARQQVEELGMAINTNIEELETLPGWDDIIGRDLMDTAALEEILEELLQRHSQYDVWQHAVQQCKANMATVQNKLDELHRKQEAGTKRRQCIDDLARCKAVLSRDGLPAAYMNKVFVLLSSLCNKYLEEMQANFTVEMDPQRSVSFLFRRADDSSGYMMRQELLSGGQAIRLTLALLLSCQQLLLPEVGFLILDEPSAHVDSAGVDKLGSLFQRLAPLLDNSETQLIVVDHHEGLTSALSGIINLGTPATK